MLWIIAIVSIIPFYWTAQAACARLLQRNPQSPWETEILLDGWRAAHHLPVYTLPDQDHATHMYGPAITYVLGAIFASPGFAFRRPVDFADKRADAHDRHRLGICESTAWR